MGTIELDTERTGAPDLDAPRVGPLPRRPVAPGVPRPSGGGAATPAAVPPGRGGLLTLLFTAMGFLGVLVIAASAPVWRNAAPSWRLTVPGIPHPGTSMQASATFAAGLVLLGLGWIGMVVRADRMGGDERRKRRIMVAVLVLWAAPAVLSTPILSNDSYSYAAQGEMASRGLDPTAQGAYALRNGPFLRAVDPIWRDAPAPYGPVSIQVQEWAVEATGHDPASAVWAMRVLALVGVAMTAAGVVVLAGQHRVSGALALTLGVTSPLVLLHMLGGSHNDSLMLGLAVLGLAAFGAGRRVLAVALLTLAVGIKLPVALALGFVGWCWYGDREVSFWARVRSATAVVASAAVALVALCSVVGIGFGWVTALKDTGKITSTFSATTKLGFIAGDLHRLVGGDAAPDAYVGIARTLGMLVAVAITGWLLLRSPRIGLVRSIGFALTAVMLLGPVLWPWYLPAGFALLAASGIDRLRPTYVVLVVAGTWTVWPTSVDPVTGFESWSHILGFLAITGIALACWLAQVLSPRAAAWWDERARRRGDVLIELTRA